MRSLAICLLGGTGFVGLHLCSRLVRDGHAVRVLTRNRDRHRELLVLPGLELVDADVYDPTVLGEAFRGRDAVINLVGILNEHGRGRGSFAWAHTELTARVVAACRSAVVPRLLQMSSLGAASDAPSRYLRSKGGAERIIREEGGFLAWTIFQPSVIFGPGDSFTNKFATLLRLFPALPVARPGTRFAPVFVADVAAAIARALGEPRTHGATLQLCGADVLTLAELVRYVRDVLSLRRIVVGLPDTLGLLQALLLNVVPGKPLSLDNFRSLKVDSICSESGLARLGIEPTPLGAVLPGYLGKLEQSARFDQFRRAAGERIGEP
jgi:uncharacterized protein YbjT (DUF2867 family)